MKTSLDSVEEGYDKESSSGVSGCEGEGGGISLTRFFEGLVTMCFTHCLGAIDSFGIHSLKR